MKQTVGHPGGVGYMHPGSAAAASVSFYLINFLFYFNEIYLFSSFYLSLCLLFWLILSYV
jgi:hypothetical protein